MKVLVVYSHSYQEQSVSGKAFLEVVSTQPNITVRNLEELYPTAAINVAEEQKYLEEADVVVFYHPVFWYNMPSLLKKYMDEVYAFGWAYGEGGYKLSGKKFLHVYTTGAPAEIYVGNWKEEAIQAPLRVSAEFVKYDYVGAMPLYGQLVFTNPNARELAIKHAEAVLAKIATL